MRCGIDKPLLGAFFGIPIENILICVANREHFTHNEAGLVQLVNSWEAVLAGLIVELGNTFWGAPLILELGEGIEVNQVKHFFSVANLI